MKKYAFFLLITGFAASLSAQTAKKYLLIEHFTNSWCSICKSRNPAFYNTIAPYAADIHHISIHPSTPYPQCVFYQANPQENQARADYYGVLGTPRVALNGTMLPATSALLPLATLQTALAQKTAPLSLKVTDAISGMTFRTNIQIKYDQPLPVGNYVLHVMIAEKYIQLTTQNGETEHRDVFRDRLTSENGSSLTAGATGMTVEVNYSAPINGAWNASQLYAIAFVQNTTTKEVLNSGTRFDLTSAVQETAAQPLAVHPNPANDRAWFQTNTKQIESVEIYGMDGKQYSASFTAEENGGFISTRELPEGIYIVKALGGNTLYTGKLSVRH